MKTKTETYSGRSCIHGHGTRRYVSNGLCVTCVSISGKKIYQKKKQVKNVENIDIGRNETESSGVVE